MRIDIKHMRETGHKVIKKGIKSSNYHGYVWYECQDCDWQTAEEEVGSPVQRFIETGE